MSRHSRVRVIGISYQHNFSTHNSLAAPVRLALIYLGLKGSRGDFIDRPDTGRCFSMSFRTRDHRMRNLPFGNEVTRILRRWNSTPQRIMDHYFLRTFTTKIEFWRNMETCEIMLKIDLHEWWDICKCMTSSWYCSCSYSSSLYRFHKHTGPILQPIQ